MKSNHFIDAVAVAFLSQPEINVLLDPDTKSQILNKKIQLEDAEFYVKKNIHGLSGKIEMITPSLALKYGTVNFDKAKLPPLEHLIIQGIVVQYVRHASVTDPALVSYSPLMSACTDNAVRSAELQIKQNDRMVFKRNLNRIFVQALGEDPVGHGRQFYGLDDWRFLQADKTFSIDIQFPDSQTVGTGVTQQEHLEVILIGQKTRVK